MGGDLESGAPGMEIFVSTASKTDGSVAFVVRVQNLNVVYAVLDMY
jgi:hypothetical protein